MANTRNTSLFVVTFLVGIAVCYCSRDFRLGGQKEDKTWCVAILSATDGQMQTYLDSHCGSLDCSQVNPGGSCYEPNTLRNHASYAIDLVYRQTGVCDSVIGVTAITDPSYGSCQYP